MSATGSIGDRLDRIEEALRSLQGEVSEIRALARLETAAVPPATGVVETPAEELTLTAAWRALERGRNADAIAIAEAVLARGAETRSVSELMEIASFVDAASAHVLEPELVSRLIALRASVEAARVPEAVREVPAIETAPPAPPVAAEAPAPTAAEPDRPLLPSLSVRARTWAERELTGSRLFALGGGALMLLGVVFLFIVAANRGWVGPGDRVVLGAVASLATLVAGVVLRRRYGRMQSSLAAVGVGVGGAYTTLAAATILYGFVPSWVALLLAAGIASVGGAIAMAWSSELLAGLALVGAAVAPGLVALDEGISAPAPAFALVVLAVTFAVAAPRRWLWLVVAVGGTAVSQVIWLVIEASVEDPAALAVAAAASLVVLGGAVGWQSTATEEGLDAFAAATVLVGAATALLAARVLLPDEREAGLALAAAGAVYGAAAIASGRRWRDLAWVVGAAALLLAGIATADLLSGRSLAVAFAIEAVVLAGLAFRLRAPRFEVGSLAYLSLGVGHVLAVELDGLVETGDVSGSAAPALFALGAAALAVALLLPARRGDRVAPGLAGALEPFWDELVRARTWIRAFAVALALGLAAAGSAGILSARALTIAWAAAAAAVALAARATAERRVWAVSLPVLALAVVHALFVESPLSTLALERGLDPLAPVPSLGAVAASCVVLGLCCVFEHRGIAFLGPLDGPERPLVALERASGVARELLLSLAAAFGVWLAGLVVVDVSYEVGQVTATFLWAALGLGFVVRHAGDVWGTVAGWGVIALGFSKAATFDWAELGDTAASVSLVGVSAAVLVAGFLTRWLAARASDPLEAFALVVAAVATVSAVIGLDRLTAGHDRVFGLAVLSVTAALTSAGVTAFARWRRDGQPMWARTLATGYWALALVTLLLAEAALTAFGTTQTLALWGATAAALALGWSAVGEPRLWIGALLVGAVATAGVIVLVTPPDRLVEAAVHPAEGFSALLLCTAAAVAVAWRRPEFAAPYSEWLAGGAALVCLYAFSVAVLELAVRVSGASVETDFQRGHTALSTLLGIAALGIYVVGLARDHRPLRMAGLTLFGLALAKLFLYDLSSLSSITRAISFLALGAVLLAAAFFAERLVRGEPGDATGSSRGPRTVP